MKTPISIIIQIIRYHLQYVFLPGNSAIISYSEARSILITTMVLGLHLDIILLGRQGLRTDLP